MSLIERIQDYLANGGLFNPEMMEHDKVRALLLDCREALVQVEIDKINSMSHYELCERWRFAPAGDPWFDATLPYYEHFRIRLFKHFGGFTPEISKQLTP